ncbi:MAG: ECF transporter S component [Promethearchaeota archaeon]|nr:MAG: ECF transporter S component [Candidatus Lokiarchaeota archaeon]
MSEIEKETFIAQRSLRTIQIAGAAIFGALSVVISAITTPIIPRIPGWGMAIFDPVSIIWIICFLIFGPVAGILCCVIGAFGLLLFDPTGIGPVFKFLATIPLVLVPTLILRLFKRKEKVLNCPKLKNSKNYAFTGILALATRIVIMIIANVIFFMFFANLFEWAQTPGSTEAWVLIIVFAIVVNAYQGALDLIIPYLVVFKTNLDEKYEIW